MAALRTAAVNVMLTVLTICCVARGQNSAQGGEPTSESAPELPVLELPTVSPPGDGDGVGDGSLTCSVRNSCNHGFLQDPRTSEVYSRNCFCDDECVLYGDCCADYVEPADPSGISLDLSTVECARDEQIDLESELYKVTSCPADYTDDYVREHCENAPTDDVFYTLPVSGQTSGVLYKNYFCALCAGEEDPSFWQPTVGCSDHQTNVSEAFLDDALALRVNQCWFKFTHPTVRPRKCKDNVGRCPKDWTDKKVRKKCRRSTAYVYVGERGSIWVFKNKFCAECNHVNDTYLTCVDPRSPPTETGGPVDPGAPPPFSILLDLNMGKGKQVNNMVGSDGTVEKTESVVTLRQCAANEVYDPFAKICRVLSCRKNLEFREGQCVRKRNTNKPKPTTTTTTQSGSDVASKSPAGTVKVSLEEEGEKEQDSVTVNSPYHVTDCPRIRLNVSEYVLLSNKSVHVPNMQRVYDPDDYIMDGSDVWICTPFVEREYNETTNFTYTLEMFKFSRLQSLVSFVGSLISLMALFIHFVVYMMLPPLRNLPGKCVISLVVALFTAQLLFFVSGMIRTEHEIVCLTIAALIHYFFLASFFWMNVMAIDIWRTFCTHSLQTSSGSGSCRFVLYSLYAWISPALIVGASLALDFLEVHELYRPHYGEGLCWLNSRYGLLFLFALPLALLLLINIIMYFATVRQICLITKASQNPSQDKEKNRFLLYVKLSVIMGLTWVFGFLAAMTELHVLWYVFIIFNTLQGAFICFAFVCTRKVFRLLRERGRVHRTSNASNGRYTNSTGGSRGLAYTQRAYLFDGEAKVISQETSI